MALSTSPLTDARLKIQRANHHVHDIEREILAFVSSEPYLVIGEIESKTGDEVYRAKIRKEIPSMWGVIIGDAIHNMRAALDIVATAIVVANSGNGDNVYFPFGNTPQHFETQLAEKVKGAPQVAIDLIRRFKPYKGGNMPLWQIHRLDRLNKHQLIIPVGAAHRAIIPDILGTATAVPGDPREKILKEAAALKTDVLSNDRQYPMKDGTEVYRIPANARGDIKGNIFCTFDVAFGEGQIVEGQAVMPTLIQFGQLVEEIINTFGRTIFNEGAPAPTRLQWTILQGASAT